MEQFCVCYWVSEGSPAVMANTIETCYDFVPVFWIDLISQNEARGAEEKQIVGVFMRYPIAL